MPRRPKSCTNRLPSQSDSSERNFRGQLQRLVTWTPFLILLCNAAWISRLTSIFLYNHLARASNSPTRSSWEPVLRQTTFWVSAGSLIPAGRWSAREGTMYPWLLGDRRKVRTPMKLRIAILVEPPAYSIRLGVSQIDIVLARASITGRFLFFYMFSSLICGASHSRALLCFGPCNIELTRAQSAT